MSQEVYVIVDRTNSAFSKKLYLESVNISDSTRKTLELASNCLKSIDELSEKAEFVSKSIKDEFGLLKCYGDKFYEDSRMKHCFAEFLDTIFRNELGLRGNLKDSEDKIMWRVVQENEINKELKTYDFSDLTSAQELTILY